MVLRQFFRFGLVGALATLVHMLIGSTLIHSGWPPLMANPASFVVAFTVSFIGHYGFSFSDHEKDLRTSLQRFTLVAVCGFAVNEAILAGLIRSGLVPPVAALILSTGTAAVLTFFASRHWAFTNSAEDPVKRSGHEASPKDHSLIGCP